MRLNSWLSLFGRRLRSTAARNRRRPIGERQRRPGREFFAADVLEERTLLSSTFVVTSVADSGVGSLREAIESANTTAGADTIAFDIGAGHQTIDVLSPLPSITEGTIIDGSTQPGYSGSPLIELSGNGLYAAGFFVADSASGTTVKGLAINGFAHSGVWIAGADGCVIEGNYIGLDVTGEVAVGNESGLFVTSGVDGILIADNVVSGNATYGLYLEGVDNSIIVGNRVGTDAAGTAAVSNGGDGIYIAGVVNCTIGGTSLGDGNVISGNTGSGIRAGYADAVIQGNFIGTDVTGTAALGNIGPGINISDTGTTITIGGPQPGAGNLISGNAWDGIAIGNASMPVVIQGNYIGTNIDGTAPLGNVHSGIYAYGFGGNQIGGTALGAGNLISGNQIGVDLRNSGNIVEGNLIGTDVSGSYAIANSSFGVLLIGGGDNLVGGSAPNAGNLISGNGAGVAVFPSGLPLTNNRIQGNLIGTDASGTNIVGNNDGITIESAGNLIGTDGDSINDAAERNVISGNSRGIVVVGSGAHDNVIAGNLIGTDNTGSAALANSQSGIESLNGAHGNRIGTDGNGVSDVAERNVVVASGLTGITMFDGHDTVIAGNFIGTDLTGTVALSPPAIGILVYGGSTAIRMGTDGNGTGDAQERNVIAASGLAGVVVFQASDCVVAGNYVGVDSTGSGAVGASQHGVYVHLASNIRIGTDGSAPADAIEGNVIANAAGNGVTLLAEGAPAGVSIRGNSIHSNGGLGIDLGNDGVSGNDVGGGDLDPGPNGLQNFPILSMAAAGAATHVAGTLNSTPGSTFTIDFYANPAGDPSGYGEGQRWLGAITVTTDGSGHACFDDVLLASTVIGEVISSTATAADGSTSEFSAGVAVQSNFPPTADAGGPYTVVFGGTVQLDASGSSDPDQSNTTLTYAWDFDGDNDFDDATGITPNFSAAGIDTTQTRTVGVRVTDSGGLSDVAHSTIQIVAVALVPDPCIPGNTVLAIGGTLANDTIVVTSTSASAVTVRINAGSVQSFTLPNLSTGRVVVFGQGGNDTIAMDGSIALEAHGGAGNDTITGGSGNDVLLGGSGNDILVGSAGHDVLVGGSGADRIVGSAGHDILIAGDVLDAVFCDYDHFRDEWLAAVAASGANLSSGQEITEDVIDETLVDNDVDQLTGSSGADLFIISLGDVITDLGKLKKLVNLDDIETSDGDVVQVV